MRTALVIGTGLIGTSAALALASRGVVVHLADHDPEQARTAAALGAGTDEAPEGPVDLAIVAVPPAQVAGVLADAMRRGVARGYLDVASVKGGPRRELEALGLDLMSPYIGTHPMVGPRASRARWPLPRDLFEGRPWVLTPTRDTDTEVLNLALELVAHCRAVPVVMDADAHDRAVALVSHMPHLVSSMVAARLENAEEAAVRLCGQGIRDVTRIAASDPADVDRHPLREPRARRRSAHRCRRRPGGDGAGAARAAVLRRRRSGGEGAAGIEDVLRRGNAGQVRVPGKHGAAPAVYEVVAVLIDDQPGQLARIFADAGGRGSNRGRPDRARDRAAGGACAADGGAEGGARADGGAAGAGLGDPAVGGRRRGRRAGAVRAGGPEPVTLCGAPAAPLPAPCTQKGVRPRGNRRNRTAPAAVIVAIDGPSGTGKSSTSKAVAAQLGLSYLDTGAQYRAITWWMVNNGIELTDPTAIAAVAGKAEIVSGTDPSAPTITVDGVDVAGPDPHHGGHLQGQRRQRRPRGACPHHRAAALHRRRGRAGHRRRGP